MRMGPWLVALGLAAAGAVATLLPLTGPSAVEARVVGVQDGDTLTVRVPGQAQEKVRLVEIDAPEQGQAYGAVAKRRLSDMVQGKTVRLERQGEDRYGRTLARVYVDDQDVNKALVRAGAAWVYTDYSTDASFGPLQTTAQAQKAGLWALQEDQRVAPWKWRSDVRAARRAAEEPPPVQVAEADLPPALASLDEEAAAAFQCGTKRTCGQMSSCAEAEFHLQQCGLGRLDGDSDGTPCEAICG